MPSSNNVRKVTSENYPTDSGREGELIFRLVYQQAGCKKPFSRLWLSSMEENAIREGFAHLKPSTEYDALYNAALCRERADWMVGINASRLFSCLYNQPLAVGRVMTPVLAMTVVREAAIAAFTPEKFYTVDLELTSGCTASSRRIPEKSVAENLLKACRKEMVATIQRITRKEKSENPPPLYDLTTLQRDANRLLGYSAQQTLDYVQSLYEKKLTTYPRTDSCYITDDDEEMLEELTEELEGFLDITSADVDEAVPRTRRTVNREKVTDHHAILPTRSMLQADLDALPKGEQNVLKLIIARTLMAVSKPFRYLETLLTTECAGEEFTAKGKEILEEGWKAVERKVLADILNRKQELTALPNAAENECGILNAELKEGQTSPPKHFTEDTLLHAMETASADSMPEGVERQGIGTPATRAATIEKLVQKGFLERKGTKKTKVLLPTDKGKALITVMPEEIQSADMTADWEAKLLQIERSEMEPETFMTEIKEMISSLVTTTEAAKGANTIEEDGKERRVLNQKETMLAQQKQQAIKDTFAGWVWQDPQRRNLLVKQYNELFNSTRPREYDGSHIHFVGMNPEINLQEHQRNAVAHVLYGGNTLLAHEVGAGKSFEMAASAMESKRLGLCQKSLFVVPNHLTEQWASEFLRLYPNAKLLVTSKKDFEPANRKRFCARIATGDYDAVIIGHSQFEKIPLSAERQARIIEDQIEEIENAIAEAKEQSGEHFTVKQMEKTRKTLEVKLKKLQSTDRKDDVVTFEQLGVDRLFVDESQNYKNLYLYTKMRNVAGLSTSEAQKSSDMFGKCRYLDEVTGGRGVIFATGTPISNSMTEMYTLMRYLQYSTLQQKQLTHFDAWASTFGETTTAIELAPEGYTLIGR